MLCVHARQLISLTSVAVHICYLRVNYLCVQHTRQKKEKKVGVLLRAVHALDWPINLCQSGNRPVNIEGPGCRGGNERGKGSLAPPSHLTAPTSSSHFLPDNPYLTLYLPLYHLRATWLAHWGREKDKRAGSHHPKNPSWTSTSV